MIRGVQEADGQPSRLKRHLEKRRRRNTKYNNSYRTLFDNPV